MTKNTESELKNSYRLNKSVQSLRQNRYKMEQYLITMQSQQQVLLDNLQKIMDELLVLQAGITGSLSQFEQKAGSSQGLQGLFYGNPLLKNEIMQKRLFLEQSVQKIREMGTSLQQKINQLGRAVHDLGRHIPPEIMQEERYLEEIKENIDLNGRSRKSLLLNS